MSNFPFPPYGIPQPPFINNQNQQNVQYNRFPPMPQYQQQGLQFNPMMANGVMGHQPPFMNITPPFAMNPIQPNMIPNPNFFIGQRVIPLSDLPYDFSTLTKQEINKILILENIDKKITDAIIYESFNELAPVEKVRFFRMAKKPFAFVFMQQKDGAKILMEENQEIKKNPNISLFNHKLARCLIHDKQIDVINLQKQYSKPEEFAKLILGNFLEKESHKIGSQMPLSFESHSIRVREIWIGYFPMHVNVEMIQKVLSRFGQLDHVDLKRKGQNFAFVKFKSADHAKNCIESQDAISLEFGVKVKVSYADFLKRNQIVGDDVFQRDNDHILTSILYVSFQMGVKLPSKKRILKKFSKVGKIVNLLIRPSADINELLKSFFLIEYENIETAKKARKHFYIEDKGGDRRRKLGDPKAEVNILLKPNVVGNIYELIAPHMMMPLKNLPPVHQQQIQQIDNMAIGQARPPPPPQTNINQNVQQAPQMSQIDFPFAWTGFITRNKKNQVGVDCFQVIGDLNNIMDDSTYNLNISHRIRPEEIVNIRPYVVLIFRPSNETYREKFQEHMNYLKERNTFGVINYFYPNNLYLVPYGEHTISYVPNAQEGDVIGLFITMENEDENDDMDENVQIKEFSLDSNVLKEFTYEYGIYYLYTRTTSNGGPFLLTDNFFESQESRFQKQNERLKKYILVFQSDGQEIAQIERDKQIVGLEFLEDERILEVTKNGYYSIYNPYDKNYEFTKISNKIPLQQFFQKKKNQSSEYEIDFILSNEDSFVIVTKNRQIFLVYDIEKKTPDRIKIDLDGIEGIDFGYFTQKSICYYKDKNVYHFYIACLKRGFLHYQINLGQQKDPSKVKNYKVMCQNFSDKVLEIIPTKGTKNILFALLTGVKSQTRNEQYDFKDVYTVKKNYPDQFHRTNLNLTEEQHNAFQGLYWIGTYAIAVGFKKEVKIISRSLPDPFLTSLNIAIEPQKIIYCDESDGLRLLCLSKDFGKGFNIIIRAKPQEYENVTGELYFTPGKLLYECHKCYQDKQSPKDKEIVDDPDQLKIAIKEIKKTIEFEIDQDKQKQYLKILSFGKLFLDGDKQGAHKNVVYELCKKLKVYTNLKKVTKRAITFEQFEKFLKSDLETFCKILINCNLFQLAYGLCATKKKFAQKNVKYIFIEYSKRLIQSIPNISSELDTIKVQQQKCANNILTTYKKIKETTPTFESKILIDVANIAWKNQKKAIAEELLKEDNPVLLKITSFLEIQEYEKAMNLALSAKDSNALYLLFYKLTNNNQDSQIDIRQLLNSGDLQIRQHFYRYLQVNKENEQYYLDEIEDAQEYFIQNYNNMEPIREFQKEIKQKKDLIQHCVDKQSKTNQRKQPFDYALKYLDHIQKMSETEMYKYLPQGQSGVNKLTAYEIAKPYFLVKQDQYLTQKLDFSKDRDIQKFQKDLNISEKQMFLFQIRFLLENIKEQNIKYVEDYIINYKNRKLGVFQLQMLFSEKNYQDSFIRILKNLDFNTVFHQCEQRKMFSEAAQIALHHNKKTEFETYINFVTPQSLKEKLIAEFNKK